MECVLKITYGGCRIIDKAKCCQIGKDDRKCISSGQSSILWQVIVKSMFLFPFSIDETMSKKPLSVPCWPFIFFQTSLSALTVLTEHRTSHAPPQKTVSNIMLISNYNRLFVLNFKRFHFHPQAAFSKKQNLANILSIIFFITMLMFHSILHLSAHFNLKCWITQILFQCIIKCGTPQTNSIVIQLYNYLSLKL